MTFTTVSNWWGNWFTFHDELFDNSKRIAFLKYKDLPDLITSPVEIAAFFKEGHDESEIAMLRDPGWRVRHVLEISDTPLL